VTPPEKKTLGAKMTSRFMTSHYQWRSYRVPCARGQKCFCAQPTKALEFEVAITYKKNNTGSGAEPQTLRQFLQVFLKNNPLLGIFGLNFCLNIRFYFTAKCVVSPQEPAPKDVCPLPLAVPCILLV